MIRILPTSKIGKALAILWLGCCLSVLFFLRFADVLGIMILILTSPFGMLGIVVPHFFTPLFPNFQGIPENLMFWSVCVIAGYIQWFVVVPRLFSRRKGKEVAQKE